MLKSTIRTDTVIEWERAPDVAVRVTVNVAGIEEVTVSVEEPEPPSGTTVLAGFSEVVKPADETVVVRFTLPEKPLMLVTVITELPIAPKSTIRDVGLGEIVKSGAETTVTDTIAE